MNIWLKFRPGLDSNHGPLVQETTALPTEPQLLPSYKILILDLWCNKVEKLTQSLIQGSSSGSGGKNLNFLIGGLA